MLTEVTDASPQHAVKVGDGTRLKVTKIGIMLTKVNTVSTVMRGGLTSLRYSVESMRLTNVLVVPQIACSLFSCSSAFKRDGIRTYLNAARNLVLPSGSCVNFTLSKRHYSVAINADGGAIHGASLSAALRADSVYSMSTLPKVMMLSFCTSASVTSP